MNLLKYSAVSHSAYNLFLADTAFFFPFCDKDMMRGGRQVEGSEFPADACRIHLEPSTNLRACRPVAMAWCVRFIQVHRVKVGSEDEVNTTDWSVDTGVSWRKTRGVSPLSLGQTEPLEQRRHSGLKRDAPANRRGSAWVTHSHQRASGSAALTC